MLMHYFLTAVRLNFIAGILGRLKTSMKKLCLLKSEYDQELSQSQTADQQAVP